MSYDLYIKDKETKETVRFNEPHHFHGGTLALGGTTEAWMAITFNYYKCFCEAFESNKSITILNGMDVNDAVPLLIHAANRLGDDETNDYWQATEGNAKKALLDVISLISILPRGRSFYIEVAW